MGDQERVASLAASWRIRPATSEDAASIAALYREVYPAPPGRPPGEGYPFPQFMSAAPLAELLAGDEASWFLAEGGGEVIGCFGAMRDIGARSGGDRVAELTGLVVRDDWRLRGVANHLVQALSDELEKDACFVIAEARTANPGGWKAAKNFGFRVIGFEPFAHSVSGRHESMVVLGRLAEAAAACRWVGYATSQAAKSLAAVSVGGLPLPEAAMPERPSLPIRFGSWRDLAPYLSDRGFEGRQAERISKLADPPRLEEDLQCGQALSQGAHDRGSHDSGVVGLRRLRGADPSGVRHVERHYAALSGATPLGTATVSVDREDLRARILDLHTACHGLQGVFLAQIVDALTHDPTFPGLETIALDVRADASDLHGSLEALGFFPSVYYPALIQDHRGRIDAVQFTRVLREELTVEPGARRDLGAEDLAVMERVLSLRGDRDPG